MNYQRIILRRALRHWAQRNGIPPWFAWGIARKTRRHFR